MKGFQSLIRKYLKDHEKRKKYLAVIMSLSTIVTFAVPMSLIMPAISMTDKNDTNGESPPISLLANNEQSDGQMLTNAAGEDGNIVNGTVYSPSQMSLKTLLIGEGSGVAWADGCNTVDEIMNAAMDEYFLGIANDFCAFIEGDFTATEADAEGRVAIGGDLSFTNDWNYQVGSGDYATMTHLSSTDNYAEIANFASAIIGGKIVRINTLSTGYGHDRNGTDDEKYDDANDSSHKYHTTNAGNKYSYTVYYLPEEGLFKRFIIGNIDDSHHITYVDSNSEDLPYSASHSHDYPGGCGEDCPHNYLDNINELAQMYQYDGTKDIISKTFVQIRERSSILSQKKGIAADGNQWGDIHLTGPGTDSKAKTVYFDLGDSWKDYRNIYFDDIPEGANIVINCGDSNVVIAGDGNNSNVHTFINGTEISNTGNVHSNNNPDSQRILYNFYNAEKVSINGNFNGTVLAPDADVTSMEEKSPGHLSGALIAKSFKGGLEFGYRPYRGGADILGAVSGYTIPVDKFSSIKDEDGNYVFLPDATFALIDTNNTPENKQDDNLVSAWNSGSETKYTTIPTVVDFSGDTDYAPLMENGKYTISKTYILEEQSAPDGYLKEDKQYSIKVEETIYSDYLLPKDGSGTFPQKVDVKVQMTEIPEKADGLNETLTFTIKDAYGDKGIEQRRIYIPNDTSPADVFNIDIESSQSKQNVTKVGKYSSSDSLTGGSDETDIMGAPKQTTSVTTSSTTTTTTTTTAATITAKYVYTTDSEESLLDKEIKLNPAIENVVAIKFTVNPNGDTVDNNNNPPAVCYGFDNYSNYPTFSFSDSDSETEITINLPNPTNINQIKIDSHNYLYGNFTLIGGITFIYTTDNSFTVTPDNNDLIVGDSTPLTIDSKALGNITWDYTNADGCTITGDKENGYTLKVTKSGDFIISGTDNSENGSGRVTSFSVHVEPFKITPNQASISNDETVTLTANKPAEWSKDNENVIITPSEDKMECTVAVNESAAGSAKITAVYNAEDGTEYTDTVDITIPEPILLYKKVNKVDGNTEISGIDLKKASQFKDGDNKYYYSPENIMVMPLPENNLDFVNTPGLLFKKVDDSGEAVTGAEIQLLQGETQITDETIWKWDSNEQSSQLIDVSKLDKDIIYTLKETNEPSAHEKALPIHFKIITPDEDDTSGKITVKYWQAENSEPEPKPETADTLTLPDSYTIKMVDNRVLGVKLTLKKVDSEDKSIKLDGAEFSLYAADDTLICSGLDGNGNIFDNENFKNLDNKYAKNGYLFPGVYYLTEDTIPDHPEKEKGETYKNPGKIYFTVSKVDNGYAVDSGRTTSVSIDVKDVNGGCQYFVYIGENKDQQLNKKDGVSINNVKSFIVKADPEPVIYLTVDGDDLTVNGSEIKQADGSYQKTFDNPVTLTKFEIQKPGWGQINPTYVEIVTADGTKYIFDQNASVGDSAMSDVNPMLTVDGSTLEIGNEKEKDEKDITVTKKWLNDEGFETLRDSITVKLYRSETELTDPKTQLTEDMAYKKDNSDVTAVLNESNNWTATWNGLESKYLKDEVKYPYYYYIKETEVPAGYDDSYSVDPDGTLVAANTLQTISLNIEKIWDDSSNSVTKPNSLTVKLQMKNGDDWVDVRNITLTSEENWKAAAENLPAGRTYRITEPNVPNGWKLKTDNNESSANDDTLTITNEPKLSSLIIQKLWDDTEPAKRPDSIKVALYRSTATPDDQLPYPANQSPEATQQDYARLLQYSLYFYDANMCGDDVDENSAYSWRQDCHTHDAEGGGIVGGFHDAGDHVMFGLPQGYTASIMNWNLYEFPEAYAELNQTEHAKIIIDYFCSFINQCVHYQDNDPSKPITEILVQKGNPTTDHSYWGTPELQEAKQTKRGNDQIWWDSNGCADIAYEYAASLASAYVNARDGNFGTVDMAEYNKYLETAKKLYNFANGCSNKQSESKIETTCYKSWSWEDDRAWAETWLRLATNDSTTYNNNLIASISNLNVSWDSVGTAAALLNVGHINTNNKQSIADTVYNQIPSGNDYRFGDNSGGWGNMRHNAAYQMTALVAAKYQTDTAKKAKMQEWAKAQMAVILGNNNESGNEAYTDNLNSSNKITGFEDQQKGNSKNHIRERTCFVTNFSKDSLLHPHYRATCDPGYSKDMGGKDNSEIIDGYDLDANYLIGGLAGGWDQANTVYRDERSIYTENEVAIDYNACFVGAAAGLWDAYRTGHTYLIPAAAGVKKQYVTPDTTAGTYYELPQAANLNVTPNAAQPQLLSFNEELPQLFMAKVKEVMAAGDNIIILDSSNNTDLFNQIKGNGADVSSLCSGKNITKIEISLSQQNGSLTLNGSTFLNGSTTIATGGSWNENTFVLLPQDINGESKFTPLWGQANISSDNITNIKFDGWGATVNYVKLYFDAGNSFTVTPSKTTLLVGDSIDLSASDNSGDISWSSDNTNVATVEANGKVTAVGIGKATITGTDSEEKEGSCEITVENFTISSDKQSVNEGDQFTITANASVDSWIYDSSKIESINSNGNNTYTVKVKENVSGDVKISAKHDSLTSNEITITVNAIQLNITEDSVDIPIGESVTLHANAKAEWSASDAAKVKLTPSEDGKSCAVEALSGKNSSVTITASRNGSSDTATVNIKPKNQWYKLDGFSCSGDAGFTQEYEGNWENVVKIEFIDKNGNSLATNGNVCDSSFGGSFSYNTSGGDFNQDWIDNDNFRNKLKEMSSTTLADPVTVTKISFRSIKTWYNEFNIKEIRLHYADVQTYTITSDKTELLPGETAILTVTDADGNAVTDIEANEWTIPENRGTITKNADGTFTYTAGGKFGGADLTLTHSNIKGKITLTTKTITANSPIRLRPDGTANITLTGADGANITYNVADSSIAEIDGSGNVKAIAAGETTFTVVCNGVETDCTGQIMVVDKLTISSDINVMNIGDEIQLTVSGNVGNVTWSSSDEEVATVDQTGKVTSKKYGQVTIKATDSDGSYDEFTINVQAIGKRPDLPENAERIAIYEITNDGKVYEIVNGNRVQTNLSATNNDGSWEFTVGNLPLTDENGKPYYYYIAECDNSGTTVTEIRGKGVKYLPSEYDNGKQLTESGEFTQLSVKNTKGEETQGEMPSAGGEGTKIYYVTGFILSSTAACYLIRRRRKRVAK